MRKSLKSLALAGSAAIALCLAAPLSAQAQDAEPVHIALADLPEVETLFFLVGLEKAKEKGLEAEITFFAGEDLAIQAILAGQADVGLGSPYSVIQNANVPVRLFYQVSRIIFFPVATTDIKSWQDMEGESMTFHQRGGPLEALAAIKAEREGITLGTPNFVPGSENRVVALQQGHIKAALIDLLNKNMIIEESPDKFHVLPWVEEVITDEALFARQDWLEENQEQVSLLVTSLLESAQELCANPESIVEAREKYNLLPDLPQELADQLGDYYAEAIEAGVYSCNGGTEEAAATDIQILEMSGQLKGTPEELAVENFWHLEPLQTAKAELGLENAPVTPGAGAEAGATTGEAPAPEGEAEGGSSN
jgi:NitT/TauT family transport system substrate-binding protein